MSHVRSVTVRSSDAAAQRRAKAIRDEANGAAGQPLGDPSTLEKSALFEFLTREPPRPRGRIPVHPSSDGAAILHRVLGEAAETTDEAAAAREYERSRKAKWRARRRAAGLPADGPGSAKARHARRKAAQQAWRDAGNIELRDIGGSAERQMCHESG